MAGLILMMAALINAPLPDRQPERVEIDIASRPVATPRSASPALASGPSRQSHAAGKPPPIAASPPLPETQRTAPPAPSPPEKDREALITLSQAQTTQPRHLGQPHLPDLRPVRGPAGPQAVADLSLTPLFTQDQPPGRRLTIHVRLFLTAGGGVRRHKILAQHSEHPDPAFTQTWIDHTIAQIPDWHLRPDAFSGGLAPRQIDVTIVRTIGALPKIHAGAPPQNLATLARR